MSNPRGQLVLRRLAEPVRLVRNSAPRDGGSLWRRRGESGRSGGRSPRRDSAPQSAARDGIALIIVLGMLSLMVLMGVSFSIYMRTGRVAAGNFRNDVCARQLLHVALNRAMQDINDNLTTNLYPSWDYLESPGTGYIAGATNPPVLDWIPLASMATNLNPRWIEEGVGAGKTEGRVGYLVVNCSGLLDANRSGGADRGAGTNAAELQIDVLPEIGTKARADNVVANRDYETLQELNAIGLAPSKAVNLATYSRFVVDQTQVYVGGPATGWSSKDDIEKAFGASGLQPAESEVAYLNLLDYVDSNSLPQKLDAPCVEAVPMINEVELQYQFTLSASNAWESQLQLRAEWAFPFPVDTTNAFRMRCTITAESLPGNSIPLPSPTNCIVDIWDKNAIVVNTYGDVTLPPNVISASGGPLPAPVRVHFAVIVAMTNEIVGSGVCDAVPPPGKPPLRLEIDMSPEPTGDPSSVDLWVECLDPRFNHETDSADIWVPGELIRTIKADAAPNIGEMNTITKIYFDPASYGQDVTEDFDRGLLSYVANRPLNTVGELGFLTYARLKTIRLYGHSWAPVPHPENAPYHKVLDHFRVNKEAATRGLVNVNTPYDAIVQTAFLDMPRREYMGTDGTRVLVDQDDAAKAASRVVTNGPYNNLSEIGLVDWASMDAGHDELRAESYIRNSCGLLGLRNNYFIIVLYAQTTKTVADMTDKSIVSSARGLAEVWRDPVTSQYVVRLLKPLNE